MTALPRDVIREALEGAVRQLAVEGDLPDLEIARAKNPAHGDYASPAALKLTSRLGRPAPELAHELARRVQVPGGMATDEVIGPYVNFRLTPDWLRSLVRQVAPGAEGYGASDIGHGEKVQVEFASVNPTGPLHIGHGRGAILGDTLARLLAFTGHAVETEYYINDYGSQARRFGQSIWARLHGQEPPEGGYQGEYVTELAEQARQDLPGIEAEPEPLAVDALCEYGTDRMMAQFRLTLDRLWVHFDAWYSERTLWDQGLAPRAIERLRAGGFLVEREGATWFAPALEDSEEVPIDQRVVIRSDGTHTYFGSDLGYLLSRFEERGFERVVEVWAADHHGYVARFRAAAAALGISLDRLVIIVHQMVNLKEGKMSKRKGRFVTLDELIERVGVDAVRYFYLLRSPEAMMDFDLELAVSQSSENPVYYAQYAHARLANIEGFAAERELPREADLELLVEPWELDLARQIAFWPEVVADAARLLEPHRIPYYVHDLADAVHTFYQAGNRDWSHRVVVDDINLTRARLELSRAARHTLKTALDLMGVSAPDRM
jgi:arginyl-tRNA synthetase